VHSGADGRHKSGKRHRASLPLTCREGSCMSVCLDSTQECKITILHHLTRHRGSSKCLRKLKELLPIMFQSFQIFVLATQRQILLECGLQPVVDAQAHGVSFDLDQALLQRRTRRALLQEAAATSSRSTDPSAPVETDQSLDAFRGNPAPISRQLNPSPLLLLWLE